VLQRRLSGRSGLAFLFLTFLALGAPACAQQQQPAASAAQQPQLGLPREMVTIQTARGPARFDVQIADSDATREKGLMFRRAMPDGEGMLFDFYQDQPLSFWMRNTLIPLDMIFVASDGRIVSIAKQAKPLDETPVPSAAPARFVIEINGGLADRLGIRPGDMVTSERLLRR
jgi:uncharacterized protein